MIIFQVFGFKFYFIVKGFKLLFYALKKLESELSDILSWKEFIFVIFKLFKSLHGLLIRLKTDSVHYN